jgi:glycosyltransferase involved in cell wall biosynthesis
MVSGKLHLFVFKLLARLSDEFIILNRKSADYLAKINLKIKFEIIPNFINESELNKNRICSKNIKSALYVGGVIASKGCDKIIEAARLMPQIQFKLVGKIGLDVQDIPANVSLLGEQNQQFVHNELLKADVFLFLSRFTGEGFSNALAEAMASGLPCIVSDWAANADMVENGRGGVVLHDCSLENITKAFDFLKEQKVRQNSAVFNIQKVQAEYLENVVVDRYVSCYKKLMEA